MSATPFSSAVLSKLSFSSPCPTSTRRRLSFSSSFLTTAAKASMSAWRFLSATKRPTKRHTFLPSNCQRLTCVATKGVMSDCSARKRSSSRIMGKLNRRRAGLLCLYQSAISGLIVTRPSMWRNRYICRRRFPPCRASAMSWLSSVIVYRRNLLRWSVR